jgi:hypothetical protein
MTKSCDVARAGPAEPYVVRATCSDPLGVDSSHMNIDRCTYILTMSGNTKRLRPLYAFTCVIKGGDLSTKKEPYRVSKNKGGTHSAKFIFKVIPAMRRQRDVIKVKPDLPEPTTKPTTFLARAPDRLLVERRLLSRCIKIDDSDKPILG